MVNRRLQPYFCDYSDDHKTHGNKICHFIGIPLILISSLGLLSRVIFWQHSVSPLWQFDLAGVLWLLACVWYAVLDWQIAASFSLVALGFYFVGRAIPVPALWAMLVIGWIVQFLGHLYFEHNRPSFLKNIRHLLIGPLWLFARWVGFYP